MNTLRIQEKNKVMIDIKNIQSYIKRHNANIDRITQSSFQDDLSRLTSSELHIEKLKTQIKNYEKQLESLNTKIKEISEGVLDAEINETLLKNEIEIQKKKTVSDNKIKQKKEEKVEQNKTLQKFYDGNRDDYRNSEKSMQREADHFFRTCAKLPDYMYENLKEMPNNRGYTWRGIDFYGEKPKDGGDKVLVEKDGDILRFREVSIDYITIYEKVGKNGKKILISKEKRNLLL